MPAFIICSDGKILQMAHILIIGGGLAGCEAAWQAAEFGHKVSLYEMRPEKMTAAHESGDLAELVCSNSLGSQLITRASGLLLDELNSLGSLLTRCALASQLPAGGALAVDRAAFSSLVTQQIGSHPNITVLREEMLSLPSGPLIIASGPLTSEAFSASLRQLTGEENLYFYDAVSPIVSRDSINMDHAFYASRYERGVTQEGDYINCPLTHEQYDSFVKELLSAQKHPLLPIEKEISTGVVAGHGEFFEGCLPIEVMASRNPLSLAFGPMRPVGLINPSTGRRPYAVLQLRQDNIAGTLFNLVGFQTNLLFSEQKRVLGIIPALAEAEFLRFGQMHRNTYINSPALLNTTLSFKSDEMIYAAGQITGIEGYLGNIASGLVAGLNLSRKLNQLQPITFPTDTLIGALCHYISNADIKVFQPMKANFGILSTADPLPKSRSDKVKYWIKQSQQSINTVKELL